MTAPRAKCPNPACGCPVQTDDSYCAFCGQSLAAVAGGQDGQPEVTAKREPFDLSHSPEPPPSPRPLPVENLAGNPNHDSGEAEVASPAESPSDCPDLEVRYNHSCVFVLNMQSTFDFVVQPLADGIQELFIEVWQSGRVIAREAPPVRPRRGAPIAFGLNYTPRDTLAGKVSFTIVAGYRKGDRRRLFAAYRNHTIYSGKEDPRRVCDSLVVEVKNNIQQGHAGDLRVDQSFDGLRESLREHSSIAVDKEFLDLINARPFWTTLALAECGEDSLASAVPAPPAARQAGRQRLELRAADGSVLQLLAQAAVRIGRHRDCEILARAMDEAGRELRRASQVFNRYHACLDWHAGQCWLRDGGYYPEEGHWRSSAAGVWVDGQRVPAEGKFIFVPGREHRITLAEPGRGESAGFELAARLWLVRDFSQSCPGCPGNTPPPPDAPACLVVRRLPGPAYLLLRHGARLAWADARYGGACVCWRQEALHFNDGQACAWLEPGRAVRAGRVNFTVNAVSASRPPQ